MTIKAMRQAPLPGVGIFGLEEPKYYYYIDTVLSMIRRNQCGGSMFEREDGKVLDPKKSGMLVKFTKPDINLKWRTIDESS